MHSQERLIVPGLGVVIVLSAFMLGVPLVYKLLVGLLGLAAAGTYFAPHAPSAGSTLPAFVRINVAGVGGLVAGAIVLGSVFLPWVGFLISADGELAARVSLTLRAGAEDLGLPALSAFFYVLIVLGVLSTLALGLPRAVAAIIAAVGLALTLASYCYVFVEVEGEAAELSSIGVGATTLPADGSLIAGVAFLVMLVLQLIPRANRSRGA